MKARQYIWVRATLLVIVAAGLAAGMYVVATVPPTADTYYPKCVFHSATGLHCPGCGSTRATHLLLNGQFVSAARCNIFAVVFVPVLVFGLARSAVRRTFSLPRPLRKPLPAWCIWTLFVILLIFAILR